MYTKKISLRVSLLAVAVAAFATIGIACGGGASQNDVDELQDRVDALNASVTSLEALTSNVTPEVIAQIQALVQRQQAATALGNIGSPGGFLQRALRGEFAGSDPVTITGPCRDECETSYQAVLAQFTAATGIPVTYTGSAEFETEIQTQIAAGNTPDIADFPQPGAVQELAATGGIINVTDYISEDWLNEQYISGWVAASTFPGPDGDPFVAGVWSRTNAKSFVWYSPDAFDAAGYEIPTTWDELVALTNQIREDGATPWCVGIESGTATGWAATDWTEDVLLRTTSLENYDNWTTPASESDRLRFDSQEVRRAIELWSDLWFGEDGNVRGGRETVVATGFDGDAETHLFSDPPGCYMIRQASFVANNWVNELGYTPGEEFDAFYFPPIDEEFGRPFLTAGDLNVAFNDGTAENPVVRDEVLAVLEFHATPEYLTPFLRSGGDISPFKATRPEDYGSDLQRTVSELISASTVVRFDGSDLQPTAVGGAEFWTAITEYIAGTIELDEAVRRIDNAWPTN